MANLFGEDLKSEFAEEFAPDLVTGTLTKKTQGARDPSDISAGPPETQTEYSFSGIIEQFAVNVIDETRIKFGDKKILMLAGTLADGIVPADGDLIEIDGFSGSVIRLIARDPAGATYTVQAR